MLVFCCKSFFLVVVVYFNFISVGWVLHFDESEMRMLNLESLGFQGVEWIISILKVSVQSEFNLVYGNLTIWNYQICLDWNINLIFHMKITNVNRYGQVLTWTHSENTDLKFSDSDQKGWNRFCYFIYLYSQMLV